MAVSYNEGFIMASSIFVIKITSVTLRNDGSLGTILNDLGKFWAYGSPNNVMNNNLFPFMCINQPYKSDKDHLFPTLSKMRRLKIEIRMLENFVCVIKHLF